MHAYHDEAFVTDKKDRGKRIWSSVLRQSGTYLKVEDTFSGPGLGVGPLRSS